MKVQFCLLFGLMCSSSAAFASEEILGRWKGRFTCDVDRNLPMELDINEVTNGRAKGVFEFRAGWQLAKYNVEGATDASGNFQLEPGLWILQPQGFRSTGLKGQIGQSGDRKLIQGTLPLCKVGTFTAFFEKPVERAPPALSKGMFDRKGPAWINAVRGRLQEFVKKRENNQSWWNLLEKEVVFSRVDEPTRKALLKEIAEARANLKADALLADLASGPKDFP